MVRRFAGGCQKPDSAERVLWIVRYFRFFQERHEFFLERYLVVVFVLIPDVRANFVELRRAHAEKRHSLLANGTRGYVRGRNGMSLS